MNESTAAALPLADPNVLDDGPLDPAAQDALLGGGTAPRPAQPRGLGALLRRIPVTLTLEVGTASLSLQELAGLGPNSVVPLDTAAGEPLVIKVNGTPIGRAEVVVAGDAYGLRVLEIDDLDLDSLAR